MKRKTKIILGIACGFLALTILPVAVQVYEYNAFWNKVHKVENLDDESVQIKNEGVNLKLLSRGTTSDGYQTQTFSYTFSPENTTDKRVHLNLSFIDGSSCNEVMSASINESEQTITLTCKGDFDKEIVLVVTSSANSSVKGIVSIGYTKKIVGIEAKHNQHIDYGTPFASSLVGLINPVTSKYTHDLDYLYAANDGDISIDDIGDGFSEFSTDLFVDIITDLYLPYISNDLLNLNNNSIIPSGSEIMEYLDSKATSEASSLKDHLLRIYAINNSGDEPYYKDSYNNHRTKFTINNLNVSVVGGETFNVSDLKVTICMPYSDYSEYYVTPESIEMENTNINF